MSQKIRLLLILVTVGLLSWGLISLISPLGPTEPQIVQGKGGVLYQTNTEGFKAEFGYKEKPSRITFSSGNSSIQMSVPVKQAQWSKENGKLKVKQGPVTFIYSLLKGKKQSQGIKEKIVLNKKVDSNVVFNFPVNLNNLKPKKENGLWHFYNQEDKEVFYIPEPFMKDASGERSERVKITIKDGAIKIIPDTKWLQDSAREYPVMIDPTLKLTVLDVYSHPQTGDTWKVSFETEGQADLKIIPTDQATIDDLDFTSLKCGDQEREPQILENGVIYYPDWQCSPRSSTEETVRGEKEAEVSHYVKKADEHTLKFKFGDQVAYAHNDPDTVTDPFSDKSKLTSLEQTQVDPGAGTMKLAKPGLCNDAEDYNSTTTLNGDLVYCDNSGRMWTANSQASVPWGCYETELGCNASSTDGSRTTCIMNRCADRPIAASVCSNATTAGHSDWRLPDKNLLESYCNAGGPGSGYHWSSTESISSYAASVSFSDCGIGSLSYEGNDYSVRCVRGQ